VILPAPDSASAERTLALLQADGIEGFVTRIDADAACLAGDAS
jgi:hypothetical protein